ncbi:MAG: alanine racemase [Elusimicrobia bacterium]|nr:alanine racemase [Elusimicrobiota bacterium]
MAIELLKWIEIDLGAIRENLSWVLQRLRPGVRLMAVVKADGYGHGAVPVARLAAASGASCLGVLSVEEAAELRAAGIEAPLVLLSPPLPSQAAEVARLRLESTVDTEALAAALAKGAGRRRAPIHLDLDFGLRRWGAPAAKASALVARLQKNGRLRLAGLSTHLDYVPGKNAVEAAEKLQRFLRLAEDAKRRVPGLACHAANSSIVLDFPDFQLDLARVGNLLYGINPTRTAAPLRAPWRFQARIIALGRVARGQPIGYASEFVAAKPMTVATVPVGYSDGLTMEPMERLIRFGVGARYWGMLRGRQAPFVGRCAISHALLDVTGIPGVKVGEPVALPIRRTAANARIPRLYLGA